MGARVGADPLRLQRSSVDGLRARGTPHPCRRFYGSSSAQRRARSSIGSGSRVAGFTPSINWGDVRSLIIHPASTTHRQLSDEDRVKAGAGPDVVRLSVGIEDTADIIADLEQAMG